MNALATPFSYTSQEPQVREIRNEMPSTQVVLLGIFLIILQVADGFLTSLGIERFGVGMEGNMLLQGLMHQHGPMVALAIAKALAIVAISSIVLTGQNITWLRTALGSVAGYYLFLAIIPWVYILSA